MNRFRPYRFVHPLRGCGDTRGDALYRDVSPNGDKGCNNQHLGARHVPATMLPQLGDNTHILFTATPPQCDGTTTTLHSPLSTLHSSHTFSAKEKDSETGLSYFGSRYYSSDLSIWLSVDPMASKYPSLSPYVYCADNPVKLVDPNGEEIINPYKKLVIAAREDVENANNRLNNSQKGSAEFRAAKKQLRAAYSDLRKAENNCEKVESAINEVRQYNNDLYNSINNLMDENGLSIDVYRHWFNTVS